MSLPPPLPAHGAGQPGCLPVTTSTQMERAMYCEEDEIEDRIEDEKRRNKPDYDLIRELQQRLADIRQREHRMENCDEESL